MSLPSKPIQSKAVKPRVRRKPKGGCTEANCHLCPRMRPDGWTWDSDSYACSCGLRYTTYDSEMQ